MILLWIICAFLVAEYGKNKYLAYWELFWISFLLSPLVGFIYVLYSQGSNKGRSKDFKSDRPLDESTPSFDEIYNIRQQFPERFRTNTALGENECFIKLQSDWIPKSKLGIPVKFVRRLKKSGVLIKANLSICQISVQGEILDVFMPFDGYVEFNQNKGDWLLYNDVLAKVTKQSAVKSNSIMSNIERSIQGFLYSKDSLGFWILLFLIVAGLYLFLPSSNSTLQFVSNYSNKKNDSKSMPYSSSSSKVHPFRTKKENDAFYKSCDCKPDGYEYEVDPVLLKAYMSAK